MEVNGDAKRGIHCKSGGNRASVSSTAGTAPNAATARRLAAISSMRCHKNTQAQLTIRDIVTKGFEAAGKSSLSGIIVARSLLLDASALLDVSSVLAAGRLLAASLLRAAGRLLAASLLRAAGSLLAVSLLRAAGSLLAVSLLRAAGSLVETGLLLDAGLLRLRFLA
jgi:hypothetical protein